MADGRGLEASDGQFMTGLPEAGRLSILRGLRDAAHGAGRERLADILSEDVRWHGGCPLGDLEGIDALHAGLWQPLRAAFRDLERRDDVFISGVFNGETWISATGHYFGTFGRPWLDIPPTQGWCSLRFGEVYRLRDGKIAEAFVLFDLIDLMRQAGVPPWRKGAGVETLAPGPATHDGVRLSNPEPGKTKATLRLVRSMLEPLFAADRVSMGMERFWSPAMMWYGPALIGATRGLDGFFRDHQEPWLTAFPNWSDGLEAPFFADGNYACYAGWPSIRATQSGPLFGLAPTARTVDIRVMDWWRREDDRLVENWVLIDFPDLFLQLGVDLFARMRNSSASGTPTETDA